MATVVLVASLGVVWQSPEVTVTPALLVTLSVLVSVTFVSGVVAWRLIPEMLPLSGVIAGSLTGISVIALGSALSTGVGIPLLVSELFGLFTLPTAVMIGAFAGGLHDWIAYPGGPGLLASDRHSRRAGYAMGATAFVVALVYAGLLVVVLPAVGMSGKEWEFFGMFGVFAAPLVAPAACIAAQFAWGVISETTRFRGAIAGLLTTVLTYVVSTAMLVVLAVLTIIIQGLSRDPHALLGPQLLKLPAAGFLTAWISLVVLYVGFVVTCWLTLPLGALVGAGYERFAS